jgi:inosine/xanthosine triphosphate pyrophosphatase family protein
MAELPLDIKNRVSHRGQAVRKVRRLLKKWYSSCQKKGF